LGFFFDNKGESLEFGWLAGEVGKQVGCLFGETWGGKKLQIVIKEELKNQNLFCGGKNVGYRLFPPMVFGVFRLVLLGFWGEKGRN
jgi:hypothetical protein